MVLDRDNLNHAPAYLFGRQINRGRCIYGYSLLRARPKLHIFDLHKLVSLHRFRATFSPPAFAYFAFGCNKESSSKHRSALKSIRILHLFAFFISAPL